MRYATVKNGEVCNIILWDGEEEYTAEEGCELFEAPEEVSMGWLRVNGEWVAPEPPPVEPPPTEDPTVIAAKEAAVEELKALGLSEDTARTIAGLPPLEQTP